MQTEESGPNVAVRPRWVSRFTALLVALTIAWVLWLLARDWSSFTTVLAGVEPTGLLLVLLFGVLSNLPYAVLFHWQLRHVERQPVSFLFSARTLFIGQVVRYLPGRVWHLVYQVSATHQVVSASALIRANVEYMLIVTWGAVGVAVTILASGYSATLAVASALAGALGMVLLALYPWHIAAFRLLARWLPGARFRAAAARIGKPASRDWRTPMVVGLALSIAWGSYILGWVMLGVAWPSLAREDLLRLCATYTLAWLIGYAALIAPAGIGVREAAFALLTPGLGADALLLLMLVVRVWLFAVEVALFLLFLPLRPASPQTVGKH